MMEFLQALNKQNKYFFMRVFYCVYTFVSFNTFTSNATVEVLSNVLHTTSRQYQVMDISKINFRTATF